MTSQPTDEERKGFKEGRNYEFLSREIERSTQRLNHLLYVLNPCRRHRFPGTSLEDARETLTVFSEVFEKDYREAVELGIKYGIPHERSFLPGLKDKFVEASSGLSERLKELTKE